MKAIIDIEPGYLQCDGPYCLATFKAPANTSASHELARLPMVWVRKKAREQGWITLTVDGASGIKLPPGYVNYLDFCPDCKADGEKANATDLVKGGTIQ